MKKRQKKRKPRFNNVTAETPEPSEEFSVDASGIPILRDVVEPESHNAGGPAPDKDEIRELDLERDLPDQRYLLMVDLKDQLAERLQQELSAAVEEATAALTRRLSGELETLVREALRDRLQARLAALVEATLDDELGTR